MLSFQEVIQAVDQLSPEERAKLRAYLDESEVEVIHLRAGTMDVDALLEAAKALREGFTDEEWAEVEQAMNDEYIEPVDENGWPLI